MSVHVAEEGERTLKLNPTHFELLERWGFWFRPRFRFGIPEGAILSLRGRVLGEPMSRVHESALAWKGSTLTIGAFSYISPGSTLPNASIGRYCSIGSGVQVMGADHPLDRMTTSTWTYGKELASQVSRRFGASPVQDRSVEQEGVGVSIQHDVWVGSHAVLKPGITLNTGCVIGAHSVVSKDVPAFAVVVGNPGRIVRFRFGAETVRRILTSQWWRVDPRSLALVDLSDVPAALRQLEDGCPGPPWQPGHLDVGASLLEEDLKVVDA